LFDIGGGWNRDEMENHGTVYATRLKRMRESVKEGNLDEIKAGVSREAYARPGMRLDL
jgi:hypothetical protein